MLIDMIHDNHGEPAFKTRYRDPAVLRGMGFEAIVIPDALAALPGTYEAEGGSRTEKGERLPPTTRKPSEMEQAIDAQVKGAVAAGMQVFFYGDALLLPAAQVAKKPSSYLCEDNTGRLCPGKPAVYEAIQAQVEELFDRWPEAAGLVMRTGEVYPEATPHLTGSPLQAGHCDVCRGVALVERLTRFIGAMHDTVVANRGKVYVHRAWQPAIPGLPNMHDDPQVYREVAARVPQTDRLMFSFKFTRGDFRRGQTFNPCLLADERPKWIEFQCEREYEGKGAIPNYQGPLWKAFFEQLLRTGGLDGEQFRKRFGVWGWSRGGGWGGPYAQREEWIDVNVRALAELYRQPLADAAEIASAWIRDTFTVAESSPPAPAITELLTISGPTVRRLLYVAALTGRASSAADRPWLKDDVLDVDAIYASAGRVVDLSGGTQVEGAIAEKREALAGVDRMQQLFAIAAPELPNKSQARDLTNALSYFHSFAATVAHLFMGFAKYIVWANNGTGRRDAALAEAAREHLQSALSHWQLHTQRHALLPGAPSMFQEQGLWERTNACLAELETTG